MGFNIGKTLKTIADPLGVYTGEGLDITGKGEAKKEAGKARKDINQGKTEALGYLDQSYGTTQALNQPVADLYAQYLPQLQQQTAQGNPQAQGYINALSGMDPSTGMPSLPTLRNDVQFDLESDPIFAQQRDQMLRQLNRRMAAGGSYASSDADNAMIRNLLPFMTEAYGRGVDNLNRSNQNALTSYGLGYQRQGDIYGRNFDRFNTLYGMANQQNQQQYDRLGNMVNLGIGGINALSGGAQAYGQNRANIATGTANAMADNRYGLAQLGIATSPLNTLGAIGSTAANIATAMG